VFVLLGICASACSQPPATKPEPRRVAEPVRLTREQVLRNRDALAMTAAYRSRRGIAAETVRPHAPADRDPLTRTRLARTNPEYGAAGPMIQGVDYVTPREPK
jgi:hypothetical protein